MTLASALATRDLAELPSRRAEAWRYSDLRAAVRDLPNPSPEGVEFGRGPFAGIAGRELVFVNGRTAGPARMLIRAAALDDLDSLDSLDSHRGDQRPPRLDDQDSLDPSVGVQLPSRRDDLDDQDSVARVQPASAELHDPHVLHLRFVSDAVRTAHTARFALTLEAGARLTLMESYEGRGAGYVSDVALSIHLGEGARLERIVVTDEPADAVSVSTATVAVEGGAHFVQLTAATGARLQRLETQVRHPGAGASVRLDGLYLLGERRHADLTTVVTHEGEGGTTVQLTKGVVGGQARGVFQGRITVLKGADKTDARMGHHALLLSDRAEVDAKPELEIWADDVACAHGNTVGALDEEALFYARSRGIPEAQARALLTEAFVGEVVERVEHLGGRDVLRGWVEQRLGRLS